jgi:hypothetical protein
MKTYTIKIENNTNSLVSELDIFGAYKNLSKENIKASEDGSWVNKGVNIYLSDDDIKYFGVNYKGLLFKTIGSPLRIKSFEFMSSNIKQLHSLVTIHRCDSHGNVIVRSNIPRPTEDEYKSVVNEHFLIDGYTKISLNKVYPNTKILITLHPTKDKNSFFKKLFREIKNSFK